MRLGFTIVCCLVSIRLFAQSTSRQPSAPNIFLITIDTLRADHVHCYGYNNIKTPAMDRLGEDGVRFSQAFTPSPITNTSHTTILTGLLPSSHGVTDFALPLAVSHRTWAELLKDDGYRTAAFIGAVILDSHSLAPGLDRGFDFYDNFPHHAPANVHWGRVERRGMDVVTRAEKWLTTHPTGSHFLWLHLYDPHDPYEPPAPYSQIYKGHLYDGEIAYADSALGHFMAYLRNRGLYQNAIIVVVGDHGESLGEHGEDTHGIFLYDATTHVPLLFKLSNNAYAGTVIDVQVRTIDILPTVLDLLGLNVPPKLDGESLRRFLTDHATSDLNAIGENDYPMHFGWAPLRSLRTAASKFIEAPRPELYDLHVDPGELHNNYVPWNKKVRTSRAMLIDRSAAATSVVSSPATVPQETVDELNALGYLGRADVGSKTDVPEPSLLPDPKDKIQEANLLHRAMMASEDNRQADARAALQEALNLDPNSPIALAELGELELKVGDYTHAAEHLNTATQLRPDDAALAFHEGQAREKLGDLNGARDALERSLKVDATELDARLLLGKVYSELKNLKAARDQYEAVQVLDANNLQAQLGLARAEIAEGNGRAAMDQLNSLSKVERNNPEFLDLLQAAYKSLGEEKQANEVAARAKTLRHTRSR